MASELPPILRQYDRLAAVAVLAVLLLSLLYLIFAGLSQTQEIQEYDNAAALKQPTKADIQPVSLEKEHKLIAEVVTPPKTALLTVQQDPDAANLCTPERRLLCVACAKPIAWKAEKCPFCETVQPAEKKLDLSTIDSDGDGLPDQWEIKHGLNPQDPTDADLDTDKDGFTNLEEFEAKTDPTDPKSHPGYETRMSLSSIEGKKLPLRAIDKMELPSTTGADGKPLRHFQVTFVSVSEDGTQGITPIRAKDGELIGKSGYRLVAYTELPKKQITVGANKQLRFINVSTIEVERVADKKRVVTIFKDPENPAWPGDPLLEQKATIAFDLPDVKPVIVAPGETFAVKGEKFTVKAVDPEKKLVKVEKNADKKSFDLK